MSSDDEHFVLKIHKLLLFDFVLRKYDSITVFVWRGTSKL